MNRARSALGWLVILAALAALGWVVWHFGALGNMPG